MCDNDNRWKQLAHMIAAFIIQEMREQMKSGNANAKIEPQALTIEQAAIFIGRSPTALYRLVAKRQIPYVRNGRTLRFLVSDLRRWLEGDRV